jgi:WD40 repeat protein
VLSLDFLPDGRYLTSGSADNTKNLWRINNLTDGQIDIERELVLEHANWVNDLAFSPDSGFLAAASFGSSLRLWKIKDDEPAGKALGSCWYQPLSVAFSPDGNLLAIGSSWGSIQLWND